jgi:hypothetical protein
MRKSSSSSVSVIIEKERLTHDQSFVYHGSKTSINSCTDKSKLKPCIFVWVIKQPINWIVAACHKHQNCQILASKVDFKSAYQQCHLNHASEIQSCACLPDDNIALLALRLMFGGAACPFEWGIISETICDLATEIAHDDRWNPWTLASPLQHLVPSPRFCADDIPFTDGKALAVNIDINDRGTHDVYIDDVIGLAIDLPETNNIQQIEHAHLLAIHACCRPVHNFEPIPRHSMVSEKKLRAEAALAELQRILGWDWDLRCHIIISLPINKFVAWTKIINDTIASGYVNAKEFESTIGRLNHLALVVPLVNHFLSRLRELLLKATKSPRQRTKISP